MGQEEIGDYVYQKQHIEHKGYCIFKTNYDCIILNLRALDYKVELLKELPKEALVDDYYEFMILKGSKYYETIHYYLVSW